VNPKQTLAGRTDYARGLAPNDCSPSQVGLGAEPCLPWRLAKCLTPYCNPYSLTEPPCCTMGLS